MATTSALKACFLMKFSQRAYRFRDTGQSKGLRFSTSRISATRHSSSLKEVCVFVVQSCLTLCDPIDCSTQGPLSSTIPQSLLKFMSIEPVMLSNHLILCCCFPLLPVIFPSIRILWASLVAQTVKGIGTSASTSVLPMHIQG